MLEKKTDGHINIEQQYFPFKYLYLNQDKDSFTGEIWKEIEELDGNYLISNLGRVKRLKKQNSLGTWISEYILKAYYCKNKGKPYVIVRIGDKRFALATLVAKHFIKKTPGCDKLIFKDRNQLNIHFSNLAWVDNETFSLYCNSHSYRKKKCYSREFVLKYCTDKKLLEYYKTGDIQIFYNYWTEIRKTLYFRDIKEIEGECFEYILDRVKRNSILGSLKGLIIMYSYAARKKYLKEISSNEVSSKIKISYDPELTQIHNLNR